jgi:ATP-dependent Clp protease, protease subunit
LPPHLPTPSILSSIFFDRQSDIFSKLLEDRILLLGSEVTDEVANGLVSQLLYLASADTEREITLYINSPGGSVQAGLAIFDAMQYIPCPVQTICFGTAASMGAFLLAAGAPGRRRSLPNSRIMIHQPLGGAQGDCTEVEIAARMILHTKQVLNTYLSAFTGQPLDKIHTDTERDFYMTPSEACDYGLIDAVIPHKRMIAKPHISELKINPPLPIFDSSVFNT